jgi:hypothetical protein
MNKFQKIGLVVGLAMGMSIAERLPIWNKESQGGQVWFPKITECWKKPGADDTNPNDPCYKMGGWWYGFVSGPAVTKQAICGDGFRDSTVAQSNTVNYVKAKIGTSMVSMVGPDYQGDPEHDCEGPAISDIASGNPLFGDALEFELKVGAGLGQPDYAPDLAVIAVNLSTPPYDIINDPPTGVGTDMSTYGGFYLTFESNHTDVHDLALELGWDEHVYNYDTWLSPINLANGKVTQEFMWPASLESVKGIGTGRIAGNFEQEGWGVGQHGENGNTIETAVKRMQSIKIRLKQMDGTNIPPVVNFKIIEFGLLSRDHVPIISKKVAQNVAKFNLNGRVLSMFSPVAKPVSVQVINLQGSLVHTQTLASGSINLSHLPAGVYIVRAPELGYSGRIMLK